MDKDADGKIAKSEAEGRMAENFDTDDTDADGFVTKEEFLAGMAKRRAARGGGPPGGGGGGPAGGRP